MSFFLYSKETVPNLDFGVAWENCFRNPHFLVWKIGHTNMPIASKYGSVDTTMGVGLIFGDKVSYCGSGSFTEGWNFFPWEQVLFVRIMGASPSAGVEKRKKEEDRLHWSRFDFCF